MARKSVTDSNDQIVVQGFRKGAGVATPYVYFTVLDEKDQLIAEWTMSTEDTNILGEQLRQEAEFATGEQEEEGK